MIVKHCVGSDAKVKYFAHSPTGVGRSMLTGWDGENSVNRQKQDDLSKKKVRQRGRREQIPNLSEIQRRRPRDGAHNRSLLRKDAKR